MSDNEFLSDDDYVPVPLKEVARHELHPIGTAARIAELEDWQRKRTKITGQVIDETTVLEARIAALEAALRDTTCPKDRVSADYCLRRGLCTCHIKDVLASTLETKGETMLIRLTPTGTRS